MAPRPAISFAKLATPKKGSVVLFMPEGGGLGEAAKACDPGDVLKRTFAISEFTGKFGQVQAGRGGRLAGAQASRFHGGRRCAGRKAKAR